MYQNKLCSVVLRKVHNKIVCFHKRIFKSNKSLSARKKDGLLSEILNQSSGDGSVGKALGT